MSADKRNSQQTKHSMRNAGSCSPDLDENKSAQKSIAAIQWHSLTPARDSTEVNGDRAIA